MDITQNKSEYSQHPEYTSRLRIMENNYKGTENDSTLYIIGHTDTGFVIFKLDT